MQVLRTIRNYCCYCGIEKDEYNAIKKDAYISNFRVWRMLHIFMVGAFGSLYVLSLFKDIMSSNSVFYMSAFVYSVIAAVLFFVLKRDSIAAQLIIYLSISLLFLFACFITQNKPESTATAFVCFLLVAPMFMIDKPFFMAIELVAASTVFLVWMHNVKPQKVWEYDLINVVIFTVIGIFLSIIANSVRIREFVLTRKLNIQKDTDELTGLKNKGALTRDVSRLLKDRPESKGILFVMDVDKFKSINDTYGHDVGDEVICQLGRYLGRRAGENEIAARFGGDEFVVFVKDTDSRETARAIAEEIAAGVPENVEITDKSRKVNISIGVALYSGEGGGYPALFKKADTALYRAKAETDKRYCFSEE
ncbi:MAG: GGDEF domain-containing protein [Lachnospiraceae bacterium]|nr:GGDEF domain-containing protein [Lachnospiraceae bacterium]